MADQQSIRIIQLPGPYLRLEECAELETDLSRHLNEGSAKLVLDLGQVEMLDSTALALLIVLLKRARSRGGDIRLAAPTPSVLRTLELMRLHHVFDVHDAPEDARAKFLED